MAGLESSMFQVVVEFPRDRDPVRMRHGLTHLLEYAEWVQTQTEFPDVRGLTSIVWGCEEPIGFGLFEAPSEERLREFLAPLRRYQQLRILPCKYLHEVMQLGREKLEIMPVDPDNPYAYHHRLTS